MYVPIKHHSSQLLSFECSHVFPTCLFFKLLKLVFIDHELVIEFKYLCIVVIVIVIVIVVIVLNAVVVVVVMVVM